MESHQEHLQHLQQKSDRGGGGKHSGSHGRQDRDITASARDKRGGSEQQIERRRGGHNAPAPAPAETDDAPEAPAAPKTPAA